MFAVEVAACSRVDQESVATQNDHGFDTFALSEGAHEVMDGGQVALWDVGCGMWDENMPVLIAHLTSHTVARDRMKSSEQ